MQDNDLQQKPEKKKRGFASTLFRALAVLGIVFVVFFVLLIGFTQTAWFRTIQPVRNA